MVNSKKESFPRLKENKSFDQDSFTKLTQYPSMSKIQMDGSINLKDSNLSIILKENN